MTATATVFDIETAPRPWAEIEPFYSPPDPFDPQAVRTGNLGSEKAAAKIEAASRDHRDMVCQHRKQFQEKAALDPRTGRVLAIGYRKARKLLIEGAGNHTEPELIGRFWERVEVTRSLQERLIGHNIHGFDLPFLIKRSWFYSIRPPIWLLEKDRWWSPVFRDTMRVWACGDYRAPYISLGDLAQFLGVGQKTEGVTGGDFARLWEEDRPKAIEYLTNDLALTHAVAQRLYLL